MNRPADWPTCDLCDKPATSMARDVQPSVSPESMYVEFQIVGDVKRGCDEHPVSSVEHPMIHNLGLGAL